MNLFDQETTIAYHRLLDMCIGIVNPQKFYETAKEFVNAYEGNAWFSECPNYKQAKSDERELPAVGETYRDIFGNLFIVLAVLPQIVPNEKPLVVLLCPKLNAVFTVPLEDFLNPKFVKE